MARVFTAANTEYFRIGSAAIRSYPFTMACWFRPNGVATNHCLMWTGDESESQYYCALRIMGTVVGDPVRAYAHAYGVGIGSGITDTTSGFVANTWQHACGIWRGTTDRSAYLNGGNRGNGSVTVGPMSGHDTTSIGRNMDATPSEEMDGRIAHAAIWDVALTDNEVQALGLGINPLLVRRTNLVGYYPLSGLVSPANKALDMSGSLRHMTDNNTVTYSFADPPVQPLSRVFNKGNRGLYVPEPFDGDYTSTGAELDEEVVISGNLIPGTYYRVITGPITHGAWTYQVGETFAAQDNTTTYSGGTVARSRTFVSVLETIPGVPPGPTDEDPTADAFTDEEDTCHALDVASWYGIMALAMGETERGNLALEYVRDHYHTVDPTFPAVKGYPAYLATDPYTKAPSPCYSGVLPHVWAEGTGGAILAWAAQGNARLWRQDIQGIAASRTDDGYLYTTVVNPPVEMQPWPDIASTGWMMLATNPNGFWDVVITSMPSLQAGPYFHDFKKNPVLKSEGSIRLLPGAVSNFTASFSVFDVDLSDQEVQISGNEIDYFPVGRLFTLAGNGHAPNDGEYKVLAVTYSESTDFTFVEVDTTYRSILADGLGGTVSMDDDAEGVYIAQLERSYFDEQYTPTPSFAVYDSRIVSPDLETLSIGLQKVGVFPADAYVSGDTKYYRFSYVYDGQQESLLSETQRVAFDGEQMPRFRWTIDSTLHNQRITGMRVYRADDAAGPFNLLRTVDFLRREKGRSQPDGAYSGENYVYIPALSSYNFDGVSAYVLGAKIEGGLWTEITITTLNGTGFTHFSSTSGIWGLDAWDNAWYLKEAGVIVERGANGAYGGNQAIILDDNLGKQSLSGGLIEVDGLADGSRIDAITNDSGATGADSDRTRFDTQGVHGMAVNDVVYHYGFPEAQYNGYFVVKNVPTADTYELDIAFEVGATTVTGARWIRGGLERLIDDSFEYALHTNLPLPDQTTAVSDKTYRFSSRIDGTYWYEKSGNNITITFYDPNMLEGREHPLANSPSIDVHGRFGIVAGRRLIQTYLVIDPHGNPETKAGHLSYSELDQFDVNPVGNLIDLSSAGIGEPTGLARLLRYTAIAKEQAMLLLDSETVPDDPDSWVILEAVHRIGNLAPEGMVSVANQVFVCSHDGIYALSPGNFAEADKTPTENLKVSEAINDVYEALDVVQKASILAEYNTRTFEIFFRLGANTYAYSVTDGDWRQVTLAAQADVMGADEQSNALIYSRDDNKLYSGTFDTPGDAAVQTKVFVTSPERGEPVRGVWITYRSASELTLNVYLDGAIETRIPSLVYTLPIRTNIGSHYQSIRARGKHFSLEITAPDDGAEVKIDRIRIEHDGEEQ